MKNDFHFILWKIQNKIPYYGNLNLNNFSYYCCIDTLIYYDYRYIVYMYFFVHIYVRLRTYVHIPIPKYSNYINNKLF